MTYDTLPCRLFDHVDAFGDCWLWTGARDSRGYGHVRLSGGSYTGAHRAVYEELVGLIQPGRQIDHLCRNHLCVNPDHLEVVTPSINQKRSPVRRLGPVVVARGADHYLRKRRECRNGHPYTAENIYWLSGYRNGRRCYQAGQDRYWAKQRRVAA